jgi:hypothetical protein
VAFLISEGAEVVDFSGPWGVFEYVLLGDDYRWPFKLYTVAATREPVEVSGGMTLVPDHTFADAPAPNIVVVPAMNIDSLAPAALDWLRAAHRNTHVTMSVCNGSFVLARAGLLDGKTVTAHHGGYGRLRAAFPSVNVIAACAMSRTARSPPRAGSLRAWISPCAWSNVISAVTRRGGQREGSNIKARGGCTRRAILSSRPDRSELLNARSVPCAKCRSAARLR